jgi:hypothetical protein
MNGLIASLEAKYSKSSARKGKGKREPSVAAEEPSEEQFAAARLVFRSLSHIGKPFDP